MRKDGIYTHNATSCPMQKIAPMLLANPRFPMEILTKCCSVEHCHFEPQFILYHFSSSSLFIKSQQSNQPVSLSGLECLEKIPSWVFFPIKACSNKAADSFGHRSSWLSLIISGTALPEWMVRSRTSRVPYRQN